MLGVDWDVDGVSPYNMMREIRCDTRDAIRKLLIRWLSGMGMGDPFSQKLASQYESDPRSIRTFHYNLFKGPQYVQVRQFGKTFFYDVGIAYAFDSPMFTITDTFGGLLRNLGIAVGGIEYCDKFIGKTNDTGLIGVDKLIKDFIELSSFANNSGPVVKDLTYRSSAGSTRTVTVAFAIAPAGNGERNPVVVGNRIIARGGTPSETLALLAIDQIKGRPVQ